MIWGFAVIPCVTYVFRYSILHNSTNINVGKLATIPILSTNPNGKTFLPRNPLLLPLHPLDVYSKKSALTMSLKLRGKDRTDTTVDPNGLSDP